MFLWVPLVRRYSEGLVLMSRRPILVGVDGSAPSSAAVSWAMAEARRHRTRLHLLIAGDPALADYAEQTVRDVAARCRTECPGVETTHEVVADHPVHALVQRSAAARMLVVGSRGRNGFAKAVLGSVSDPVAARSDCPVIVLRSGKKSAQDDAARAVREQRPALNRSDAAKE